MKKSLLILGLPLIALLLGNSQCTEVIISTEVEATQKISDQEGNFNGDLDSGDQFGSAVAGIGDLEGDGVNDLVVGAPGDDENGDNRGAVWVLFMNSNGQVDISTKISDTSGGFGGDLDDNDHFGAAVAGIGDLNADGFRDIAVGVPNDDDGGDNRGAVWILFMNADGTARAGQKISQQSGGFSGSLDNDDQFGNSIAALGDVDGDGVTDLAVGARNSNNDGTRKGAVWILFMNSDGTVRSSQRIDSKDGGFDGQLDANDRFGHAVAGIGDLNGDGIPDLAVGADGDDEGGSDKGATWILFLTTSGSVSNERKIAEGQGDFEGGLSEGDRFGSAVALAGDQDGNGVNDIIVGAREDDDGGTNNGAVWVLFMKTDGRVNDFAKISETQSKFDENLNDDDEFGGALAGVGNLNGQNSDDFAVGAALDDDGNAQAGAVWLVFMKRDEKEERTGFFSNITFQ